MRNMQKLRANDFESDQEIRWCPGCGDYSILKQIQISLAELNIPKENIVFVSGIGCSSRLPYYMNTFGLHGIHGRAPAIATGIKLANPNLSVWIVTGDGDGLSIGGNHLIHHFRRNMNTNILLFNNEIYGLTKGQFSPTSPKGSISKSSPYGSIEIPFNSIQLSISSGCTFVAKINDRDSRLMKSVFTIAEQHNGTSFVEIYQNCNVFNDLAFDKYTNREMKANTTLKLEHGKPLIFNKNQNGIILDGTKPRIVKMENYSIDDLWIHNNKDKTLANLLSRFIDKEFEKENFPCPFGIYYMIEKKTYEDDFFSIIQDEIKRKGKGDFKKLFYDDFYWEVI